MAFRVAIVPVATGMALAEKVKQTGNIALVFLGDGTLGEGAVYESLNMASLWKVPILFVVENNRYAQTTPIEMGVAGSIAERFTAFGIPTWERETFDVLEIQSAARSAIQHVRKNIGPAALILHTQRFMAHSKGDDPRSAEELARIRLVDPLEIQAARLTASECEQADLEIAGAIQAAFEQAGSDPFPELDVPLSGRKTSPLSSFQP